MSRLSAEARRALGSDRREAGRLAGVAFTWPPKSRSAPRSPCWRFASRAGDRPGRGRLDLPEGEGRVHRLEPGRRRIVVIANSA